MVFLLTIDDPHKAKVSAHERLLPMLTSESGKKTINGGFSVSKTRITSTDRSARLENESREKGLSKSTAEKRNSL